jgi:hypothetical protein
VEGAQEQIVRLTRIWFLNATKDEEEEEEEFINLI